VRAYFCLFILGAKLKLEDQYLVGYNINGISLSLGSPQFACLFWLLMVLFPIVVCSAD
jgi:hypothetical protein